MHANKVNHIQAIIKVQQTNVQYIKEEMSLVQSSNRI